MNRVVLVPKTVGCVLINVEMDIAIHSMNHVPHVQMIVANAQPIIVVVMAIVIV